VKYLSQKFVDRLCDGDHLADELQREVEDVIFQHLDEDAQMGCDDFRELREFRTGSIREARASLATQIQEESQTIAALEERYATVQKRASRRQALPGLLAGLIKAQPKIDSQATALKVPTITYSFKSLECAELWLLKTQSVEDDKRRVNRRT
jgi:hypothetical protein